MKKTFLLTAFIFTGALAFGQNLKDYTLVSYYYKEIKGAALNVEQRGITKYAIPVYLLGTSRQENDNLYTYWLSNNSGGGLIIEITPVQANELAVIEKERDGALILLTRTDKKTTYKSNIGDLTLPYKLTANRIIPLKEVYGIVMSGLTREFWKQGIIVDEIVKLYLDTGKTDSDGRVARFLKN